MKGKTVFGNSNPGSKYESLYRSSGIKFVLISNRNLLLCLLGRNKIRNYHLRYLGLKDFKSYILFFIVPILLKLRGVNFIWTMHNYLDHYSKFDSVNVFLNFWILSFADECIVFHHSIKNKIPFFKSKIHVTDFWGTGYRNSLMVLERDRESILLVEDKLGDSDYEFFVVSISTAKKNLAYSISPYFEELKALFIYIDPNGDFETKISSNKNVLYINSEVGLDFWNYVSNLNNCFGVLGHYNYSVATSLFMFAEFKMPIICIDIPANNEIVKLSNIGKVFSGKESFINSINELRTKHCIFAENCQRFIANYSNEGIYNTHKEIFNNCFQR